MPEDNSCLFVVPIEPLEERYSANWLRWTQRWLLTCNMRHLIVLPQEKTYDKINTGEFLDAIGTNWFKAKQLSILMKQFQEGRVGDGSIFWFHDMWFPGIEMLAYIRDATGIRFKIFGMLHAGTYDPYDFLHQKGMYKWGEDLEHSWFKFVDGIFVATEFHKDLLLQTRRQKNLAHKIHITGFPIYNEQDDKPVQKENIVVFPHRLSKEKGIADWDKFVRLAKIAGLADSWQFIRTKDVCKTKQEYYELLRRAKYAVSFARQETWGIAMQEAVLAGCVPIVPDRLSYSEMYPYIFRYKWCGSSLSALRLFNLLELADTNEMAQVIKDLGKEFCDRGSVAFDSMWQIMKQDKKYAI